jgi:activating signal cointegrator complex subunit 3
VHSRKETIKFAEWLGARFKDRGEDHELLSQIKRDSNMGKFKHKELTKLCPQGIGFHNAGLLRRDRNIVEKLFMDGNIRILVTTATLAWGVNLPVHAVVIKGTDLYEPTKGNIDLSMLDIQQIFGSAGRPQFDTSGEATLITKFSKVNYYMGLMANTMEIESQFMKNLKENLNAEIALGTVTNIHEAKEWIKYTFFYIRLLRNPKKYNFNLGKARDANGKKAEIEEFLQELLTEAVKKLNELRLIRHDTATNFLNSTELGRIASHFYIHTETMEHFCKELKITEERSSTSSKLNLTDEKLLAIICRAKEFENVRLRPEETEELNKLAKVLFVRMGNEHKKTSLTKNIDQDINQQIFDDHEKVFALMQGYLMHCEYDSSSLIADTICIVQNSLRILRCMLEITMKKNMANCVHVLLNWCKLIENKMAPDDHPLEQFCYENNMTNYSVMKAKKERKDGLLSYDLINRLQYTNIKDLDTLRDIESSEISQSLGIKQGGGIIKKYVSFIPIIHTEWTLKPIA